MKRAVLAIAVILAAGTACKKKREKPASENQDGIEVVRIDAAPLAPPRPQVLVISQVRIEVVDSDPGDEIYEEELAKQIGRQLTGTEFFAAEGGELPPGRQPVATEVTLVISHDVVEGTHSGASLVATVEGRLRATDGTWMRPLSENVLFERVLEPSDRDKLDRVLVEHLARSVDAVGRALINQARLREASDAELISTIADDGDDRAWAIATAGDRKLRSAVDVIAQALSSPDPAVSDAALAALVEIRDPAAVPAMTDAVDFKDYDQVRAVVEAVSAIGGDDAATFLEFVASGHADPAIAARAKEALERLPKRDAGPN